MSESLLYTNISQLVTPAGPGPKRGRGQSLQVIADAAFTVADGVITWVGRREEWRGRAEEVDLGGRAVLPGLTDPHTHAIWAGERLADFEARVSGVPYEKILAGGGGIRSTVRHTAAASISELVSLAIPRIEALCRSGATTIEVKSGYGFTMAGELASLEAIAGLAAQSSARILATLLIHLPPIDASERTQYLDDVCGTLIPEVAKRKLAVAVDIFIEREAFLPDDARRVFAAAKASGLRVKAHVDQFHAIGGVEVAIEHQALSVDHLEASGSDQIAALGSSDTVSVLLPGVTLHLGLPAAPGRALIDAGAIVAVGTDLNPGSSPVFSTQMALALAVRLNGLTPAEALIGGTVNAAAALGLHDTGFLGVGGRGDFVVLHSEDWRDMIYQLGAPPVARTFVASREILT